MTRTGARGRCGSLLLLVVVVCAPALADRLHLEGGGVIDTSRWWIEDDWLHYESPAGTIGVPRATVVRIEETAPATSAAKPTTAPGTASAVVPQAPRAASPAAKRKRLSLADRQEIADLMARVRDALETSDFETAGAACREILGIDPGHSTAKVGYAISEMSLGRDGIALSVVLEGLVDEPDHAELLELLGDLRNREERVDEALRSWRAAFEQSPSDRLREKILKGERELKAGGDFDLAATSHFTVRYDGDVDQALANEVMDHLETQYWELADRFRHAPPQAIPVQLLPTKAFRDVTQTPEWVGGLYDGKIRVPLGGLRRLDPRARSVLVHELTHAVVHSKTRGRCPRWLHEGLAQVAEGKALNSAQQAEVRKLLVEHGPAKWDSAGFSYPAALSLTRFLEARRGFDGLVWLLESLGEGSTLDGALMRTYGLDYAGLCRQWGAQTLDRSAR